MKERNWVPMRETDFKGRDRTLSKLLSLPSEKRSCLKKKEFVSLGANSFPFESRSFFRRGWCAEKQTGSRKSYLPGIIAENQSNCIHSHSRFVCIKKFQEAAVFIFFSDISPRK